MLARAARRVIDAHNVAALLVDAALRDGGEAALLARAGITATPATPADLPPRAPANTAVVTRRGSPLEAAAAALQLPAFVLPAGAGGGAADDGAGATARALRCADGTTWAALAAAIAGASGAYAFGPVSLSPGQVFYATRHSIAVVNLKPVVPGHVLVLPRRRVPRFVSLLPHEVADLWLAAQRVGAALEAALGAGALNLAVQDGAAAGQSVPHVHVHVLPRVSGDIVPSDDVYGRLDEAEAELARRPPARPLVVAPDDARQPRTLGEMEAEAARFRRLFAASQEAGVDPF